jgi:hypothetical protein
MYAALRHAVIAEVLRRIAQRDCPSPPSYNLETLEHVIMDLVHEPVQTAPGRFRAVAFPPAYGVAPGCAEAAPAKAGPYSKPFVRHNNWTGDHVPGYPVEVCRHGQPPEPEIIVLQRFAKGTLPARALNAVKSGGPPYYPAVAPGAKHKVQAPMPTTAPTMPPPASADPTPPEFADMAALFEREPDDVGPPTAFHLHEALHTTYLASDSFDRHVLASTYVKATPAVQAAALAASDALANLYQLLGAQDYPG